MLAIFLPRIAAGQLIYAPVEAQLRIKKLTSHRRANAATHVL